MHPDYGPMHVWDKEPTSKRPSEGLTVDRDDEGLTVDRDDECLTVGDSLTGTSSTPALLLNLRLDAEWLEQLGAQAGRNWELQGVESLAKKALLSGLRGAAAATSVRLFVEHLGVLTDEADELMETLRRRRGKRKH